jgi:hypothetical protein
MKRLANISFLPVSISCVTSDFWISCIPHLKVAELNMMSNCILYTVPITVKPH